MVKYVYRFGDFNMTSKELYERYLEALKKRYELENKISDYIERWKNGETALSTKLVEETLDKGYERLEELRQLEQRLHQAFISTEKSEKEKETADTLLRAELGQAISNTNIVGGVLSKNASESHLIGEEKTAEQLEQEKNQMLANIKSKVKSGELTLAEASKLVSAANTSYEFYANRASDMEKPSGKSM